MLEKQKAKAIYGLLEKQFRKYFEKASQIKGNTAEAMIQLLEMRLDNVIYRLGLATTRRQARQLVSHGFVLINGKLVDIPSYGTRVGEVISVKENKKGKGIVKQMAEFHKENQVPKWLVCDVPKLEGKITGEPQADDFEKMFDPRLIVEYYSR